MITWAVVWMTVKLKANETGLHLLVSMVCDVAIFTSLAEIFK